MTSTRPLVLAYYDERSAREPANGDVNKERSTRWYAAALPLAWCTIGEVRQIFVDLDPVRTGRRPYPTRATNVAYIELRALAIIEEVHGPETKSLADIIKGDLAHIGSAFKE